MTLIAPAARSLGWLALKDGLPYVFFLLALARLMAAFLLVTNWFVRSFSDRSTDSKKQTTFSKGANR